MTRIPQRLADGIVTYSKPLILVLVLMTALMGAGMPMVEQDSDLEQFESESPAVQAQEYIQQNFTTAETGNQTTVQLIQRAGENENALAKQTIIDSLAFQQRLLETESIQQTLSTENPLFGVANVLGDAALRQSQDGQQTTNSAQSSPTVADRIDAQKSALRDLEDEEYEALVSATFDENAGPGVLSLLPRSYEPGATEATATLAVITQDTAGEQVGGPDGASDRLVSSQLEIRDLALEEELQYSVFGFGIITEEIDQSLGDSLAIVGPLALLFVVLALTIAYRDPLDIVLGVVGIIAVLIWVFGFMGWTGIAFNQLLISVPVLLIGLSIDYAIHVFMRHREQRAGEEETRDLRRSLTLALGGVGVALVWVTATAAIGFLANLTSPIGPLRDFGVTAAFGVFAALVIFGMLIPGLKIELDGLLERAGIDRQKRAFGTGDTAVSGLLSTGATAARRFPVAVVVIAVLLTAGGVYGATQVDTSFQQEDFLADEPPAWTQNLPEPFAPGTYQAKADLEFIQANFQPAGNQADLLIRGNVTNEQTLQWMADSTTILGEKDTVLTLQTGEPELQTPLSVMQQTVASIEAGGQPEDTPPAGETDNETATDRESTDEQPTVTPEEFLTAFNNAADEDGIPQENVTTLYDMLLAVNPSASEYLYRNDAGEYEALRATVEIRGDAATSDAAADLRAAAQEIEDTSGSQLQVQATGDQVIFNDIESDLLETVIQGLLITLVAVFLFMALAYRLTGNPASLGVVTLLPVVLSVSWILGSMWLLEIPFNTLTGTITSLTIGLGIAYSIHISSRYELELRRQGDVWDAMETTVTGTGGALLGSAATTVGAFGTLSLAIFPVLQQFGIITGLTIIYAFLASVLVLPALLVLWTRYLGPKQYFQEN